jgi:hypothetical protein
MENENSKIVGDVLIFNEEESSQIARSVIDSPDLWIRRGPVFSKDFHFFFSRGVASSTDALGSLDKYLSLAIESNAALLDMFSWIYPRIESALSSQIGECKVEKGLAHPGFHIFHYPETLPEKVFKSLSSNKADSFSSVIHYDRQHMLLLEWWDRYRTYEIENTMSFTIPVLIPSQGTGLNIFKEDKDICLENIKLLDVKESYNKHTVSYSAGTCIYHIGKILHQANVTIHNMLPGDMRITVQGHGVKCDGIWRLYF